MKRILTSGLCLLAALAAAPLFAGEPCGCGSCGVEDCCPANRWFFHVERVEKRYKVDVETKRGYATPAKTTETTVPVTRCVPVTVTDPCTGCTRTEMKEVCDVEKVKTTCLDIIPLCDKCGTKTEERVKVCTTVYMDCRPCVEPKKVVAPEK